MGASPRYLRTGKGSKRRPTEMRVPVSLATAVRSAMAPSAPNVRLVPSSSASVRVERERLAAEEEEKEGSPKGIETENMISVRDHLISVREMLRKRGEEIMAEDSLVGSKW